MLLEEYRSLAVQRLLGCTTAEQVDAVIAELRLMIDASGVARQTADEFWIQLKEALSSRASGSDA